MNRNCLFFVLKNKKSYSKVCVCVCGTAFLKHSINIFFHIRSKVGRKDDENKNAFHSPNSHKQGEEREREREETLFLSLCSLPVPLFTRFLFLSFCGKRQKSSVFSLYLSTIIIITFV